MMKNARRLTTDEMKRTFKIDLILLSHPHHPHPLPSLLIVVLCSIFGFMLCYVYK